MFSKGWGEGGLRGRLGEGKIAALGPGCQAVRGRKLTKKPAASIVQARVMQGEPVLKYESSLLQNPNAADTEKPSMANILFFNLEGRWSLLCRTNCYCSKKAGECWTVYRVCPVDELSVGGSLVNELFTSLLVLQRTLWCLIRSQATTDDKTNHKSA